MEYSKIKKGRGQVYAVGDYMFKQTRKHDAKIYVRCEVESCTATGTLQDHLFHQKTPHSDHWVPEKQAESLNFKERCRKRAETERISLREIFADERRKTAVSGISFAEVESSMCKRRRASLPPLPTTIDDVERSIQASSFDAIQNLPYYRGHIRTIASGDADVFASDAQLELLTRTTVVHVDATFRVVPLPALYYQLFTVFAHIGSYVFPVMFALMTKKSTELYVSVFKKLQELAPNFTPTVIMADFEHAPATAIRMVYGEKLKISGCWFHYSKAVLAKVKNWGFSKRFRRERGVAYAVHIVMAIPLLPSHLIAGAVDEIRKLFSSDANNADFMPLVTKLCDYVQSYWFVKIGFDRLSVFGESDRTNNGAESFHAKLKRIVKVSHPNFYTFLQHLQNISIDEVKDAQCYRNGKKIRRPKKLACLLNDSEIKNCMARLARNEFSVIEFLQAVSQNIGKFLPSAEKDKYDMVTGETSNEANSLYAPVFDGYLALLNKP